MKESSIRALLHTGLSGLSGTLLVSDVVFTYETQSLPPNATGGWDGLELIRATKHTFSRVITLYCTRYTSLKFENNRQQSQP